MRVDLKDGSWAELREHPTHAQLNIVRRALLRTGEDPSAAADVAMAYISAYVSAWSVRAADGTEIPLERAEDAPDDPIQAFAAQAAAMFRKKPDPKGLTAPSPSSPPVSGS